MDGAPWLWSIRPKSNIPVPMKLYLCTEYEPTVAIRADSIREVEHILLTNKLLVRYGTGERHECHLITDNPDVANEYTDLYLGLL